MGVQCQAKTLEVTARLGRRRGEGEERGAPDLSPATGGAGLVQLETPSTGSCTLFALNQEIWGSAPLVVETDSDVTVNYGFNNLSDEKVKTNIADADLERLQGIFDGAHPKTYDGTDIGSC